MKLVAISGRNVVQCAWCLSVNHFLVSPAACACAIFSVRITRVAFRICDVHVITHSCDVYIVSFVVVCFSAYVR